MDSKLASTIWVQLGFADSITWVDVRKILYSVKAAHSRGAGGVGSIPIKEANSCIVIEKSYFKVM